MNAWNLVLFATLDREPVEGEGLRLGRRIAGEDIAMVASHNNRFGVTATVESDDPRTALAPLSDRFKRVLADAGYTVLRWESLEVLSGDEVQRRLAVPSIPPMVSAAELAEMCDVSKQRVYELEAERKRAVEEGRPHSLPTPVVPGWWLKSSAEHYAQTRKRKPGPARHDNE